MTLLRGGRSSNDGHYGNPELSECAYVQQNIRLIGIYEPQIGNRNPVKISDDGDASLSTFRLLLPLG